jgi:hypothetical protein
MKKIIKSLFLLVVLSACTSNNNHKMTVSGEIKGLKKGTLYLQKIKGGTLSTIDSIALEDTGVYELYSDGESGTLHFLSLDKSNEKSIPFFGTPGVINIDSQLEKFVIQAKISGSKNQEILDNFNDIATKFQNQNLEMIKESLEAQKEKDVEKVTAISKRQQQQLRRKYLYTTNFAITHADSEVAPYLALTVLNDANIKLLDTINQSLSAAIKNSTYGKELKKYITSIKEIEK